MSEHSEENEELVAPPPTDSDVISLIKKMQQQLNYLEKKIDILIGGGQAPERPFRDREKRFSKPSFRPSFGGGSGGRDFNRGPRREGFDRPRPGGFSSDRPRSSGFSKDRAPREGGFSSDRPRSSEGGFDRPRERSSSPERSFDRKPGGASRGFGHGDKPFFRHRKGPR